MWNNALGNSAVVHVPAGDPASAGVRPAIEMIRIIRNVLTLTSVRVVHGNSGDFNTPTVPYPACPFAGQLRDQLKTMFGMTANVPFNVNGLGYLVWDAGLGTFRVALSNVGLHLTATHSCAFQPNGPYGPVRVWNTPGYVQPAVVVQQAAREIAKNRRFLRDLGMDWDDNDPDLYSEDYN